MIKIHYFQKMDIMLLVLELQLKINGMLK
jgi:hypothetical protein